MAEEVVTVKKTAARDYIFAVGRRKESVARVRLYKTVKDNFTFGNITVKKGDFLVNGKAVSAYFPSASAKVIYENPFNITSTINKYTITVRIIGGGQSGQLDAMVLGIARALSKIDPENRGLLKKKGLLARDARVRERRKVGMGGKARRQKQSPKR
jgi:small subunit ribosomal protein S9